MFAYLKAVHMGQEPALFSMYTSVFSIPVSQSEPPPTEYPFKDYVICPLNVPSSAIHSSNA